MKLGMAVVSRIVTGEEPCLRKIQHSRTYELPTDARLIKHKLKHEMLVSKVVSRLSGEIYVNYRVEKDLGDIQLAGYIDILNINGGLKTVIEMKSGKEKDSHHVQLFLYMNCLDDARGILKYPNARYLYFSEDIPENLWEIVKERLNPLLTSSILSPVRDGHCVYCRFRSICQ
jgi:CRISPR/Cas system-associated exonuclease Cas4 (RecB family)